MEAQSNRQRLLDAGFTDEQAAVILDLFEQTTARLVTRDYLDQRLLELSEHVDNVIASSLQRQKQELLLVVGTMLAPLYALVIFLVFRIGL